MKIQLHATGLELTSELQKYARRKIARLNKKVPRPLRAEAACEVRFVQTRRKGEKFNRCSILFQLDGTELKVEETTLHMYTSLDIAAVHMERQVIDFRSKRGMPSLRARIKRVLRKR